MDLERFRTLVALPLASLFLILLVCDLAIQRPPSMGIRIPMMRVRPAPLTNCEFNGFTVYLRSDGQVAGGDRDDVVSMGTMLSRIKEATDDIQDDTIFVIADPDVSYGQFAELIANIRNAAPPDHIAVVTREGQITMFDHLSGKPAEVVADRCRFEWPAVKGQPTWQSRDPIEQANASGLACTHGNLRMRRSFPCRGPAVCISVTIWRLEPPFLRN
jgi:biopolymer transport protein ExbD